ncbi:MAG: TVP38/TMEM64 family protein [bacterium]|nr:TVP38/TMEM64 family protein [bacterium]
MTVEGAARRSALEEGRATSVELGRRARARLDDRRERIEDQLERIPQSLPERAVMQRWVRIALVALLVLCAGLVIAGFANGTLRSLESLQQFVGSLGLYGPVVYIVLVAAQCIFPIIPGGIGIVAGPVLFGPWLGFLFNWIGISLGSFGAFWIARHFGMGIIERIFPAPLVGKFQEWTDRPGFTRLFAVAILLPVAPDDLLCYLAGTTRVRFSTYALIIVTCKPWTLAVYSFGLMAALQGIASWLG